MGRLITYPDFHVMTKPVGPICNLDCKYCYYLAKEDLYPGKKGLGFRMPQAVLESYVRQYMEAQAGPVVNFAWQGGEPTLLGVDYFRQVVQLQQAHLPAGKQVQNAIQTNGTLLDDGWASFFKENNFLVGISIDGPESLHDGYRVDKGGHASYADVVRGLRLLQAHGVEYNILCTVNALNVTEPVRVYEHLKELGGRYLQFIPIVERDGTKEEATAESVPAAAYGEFLCGVFDRWVRSDVGSVFVQIFDNTLSIWLGEGSSMCVFAPTCGSALALEHNGDLYSCDHFVRPSHHLGNLKLLPLVDMVNSGRQVAFGQAKQADLPAYCRSCEVRFACNGECPKNRFTRTPDGEAGLNYLCPSYKHFYKHVAPHMNFMARELQRGRPAANIMLALEAAEARR
jgi:uncharacterized protein